MPIFGSKAKDDVNEFEQMRRAFSKAERPPGEPTSDDAATETWSEKPMSNISVTPISQVQPPAPQPMDPAAPPDTGARPSLISRGSAWHGTLKVDGSVRVEGEVSGEIEAGDTVHVTEGAFADAVVHAAVVIIAGKFHGQINCRERLEILATGRVEGEITTKLLVVHEGAFVDGRVSMTGVAHPNGPAQKTHPDRENSPRVDESTPKGRPNGRAAVEATASVAVAATGPALASGDDKASERPS